MMKNLKKWFAVILVSALALSVTGCGKQDTEESEGAAADGKVTVTIGYLPITHALAVFKEKQLLEEDSDIRVELEKFSSWSDLTDALNAGRIDGASVLIELAMNAVSQGIDLKAVALGHKDGNVVVVNNDIQSVEQLRGKTFAIPHTQSSHNILLNDMLAEGGLTLDDIEVVQLSPSEMPSSLASGSIAGYCVAEPFGAQAVSQKFGHVLYYSEDLWENSLCCGLVFNGDFIEKNQDVVSTFAAKYYEVGNLLDKNTAQTVAEEYLGQDADVLKTSLQWIHYDDLKISKEDYQVLCDKVIEYGINQNPPSYEDFVYLGD